MPPNFRRAMSNYDALEALRAPSFAAPSRLTKLYTDTKQSSLTAAPPVSADDDPDVSSLNRKLRIQKDRLVAWGLEWTDEVGNAHGDIDKSVERAGLTEVVSSVMENIKGILEEVERLKRHPQTPISDVSKRALPSPVLRKQWSTSEKEQYGDFVRDLTAANDLLCELSRSRRDAEPPSEASESRGTKSASKKSSPQPDYNKQSISSVSQPEQSISHIEYPSQPSAVFKVHHSMLLLPEEGPPPYHAAGSLPWGPTGPGYSPRTFGHLRRAPQSGLSATAQSDAPLDPVLIEYVSFDRIYKTSDIPLPLDRLDQLFILLDKLQSHTSNALSKLIAYFEDPEQARFGLVFEMPSSWAAESRGSPQHIFNAEPISLFALLQNASKLQSATSTTSGSSYVPPLEDRFRLAYEAVSAFSYLQKSSFTHRNVSSSSIALPPRLGDLSQTTGEFHYNIRKPVICSFDLFSEYDVDSSPEFLHQNIYRHPDDPRVMGPTASSNYDLRFDLYSLGLVLLEIGMWHPLADLFKEKYSLKDFRMRVERIWIKRLASRCGTAYMRCVQDCFNAGVQSASSNGGPTLAQVYATVKDRLERCCSIDSDDDEEEDETDDLRTPSIMETASTYSQALEKSTSVPNERNIVAEPEALTPQESFDHQERSEKHAPRYQFPSLELPAEVLWQWNNAIEGRLARIVQRALGSSKESCCIYLCYTGENEQLAKPTICVGCNSVKKVKGAIRRHLKYNNEVFDLAVLRGSITRSKSSLPRRSQGKSTAVEVRNPYHHQRPLCGASIGAWRDSEHSPAVSFGGIVMIDDAPYGMSVHHLLEDPEGDGDSDDGVDEPQGPMRSMDRSRPPMPGAAGSGASNPMLEMIEYDSDDDDDELGDDDDTDIDFDIDDDDTIELDQNAGDTDGVSGGHGDEIIITQPALPDVGDDFFPNELDRDEDHIDSHALGRVHASSGLRRCQRDGVEHEIDWLLLKLDEDRLQPYNLIAGGKRYCQQDALFDFRPSLVDPVCRQHYPVAEDLYPRHIARSDQLSGLQVHCVGRTSGLGHGRISQTMHLVRFQGRRTFSRTWSVTGTFGCGGDSGAWVVDNEQGRICGHVLAWSMNLGMAYVSPMDVMFDDIRTTLQAKKVCLPGADDEVKPANYPITEIRGLTLEDIRHHKSLLAKHMLASGNPARLEREWAARRSTLGQLASG